MATDTQWMPIPGRHSVSMGASLGRALKARKGEPVSVKKGKGPPALDFYSFRYKFKPESIDSSKPSNLTVTRDRGSATVKVERPSTQSGERHIFVGNEAPAKAWECVLVYDEESGVFTIEKIDSFVNLKYDRREGTKAVGESSHLQASSSTNKQDDLEAQLPADMEDAEGELDEEEGEITQSMSHRREEEEEEELPLAITTKGKGRANGNATAPQTKPPLPTKTLSAHAESSHQRSKKPSTFAEGVPPPARAPPTPSNAPPRGQKRERERDFDDVEEESLEFGKPSQPTKRRSPPSRPVVPALQPQPEPEPEPFQFALPERSGGTGVSPLPPALVTSRAAVAAQQSDSDEDWEEVDAQAPAPPAHARAGTFEISLDLSPAAEDAGVDEVDAEGEGEGDDDEDTLMKELEEEMNQQLSAVDEDGEGEGDDDEEMDFLAAAITSEPGSPQAEGAGVDFDADDYSSSDDSDED